MPAELSAFCQREYPRLVGALDLYLGDLHVAEELAQEALLRACQRWSTVSQLESPGGWTHRVAMNLGTSQLRRRSAEARARRRLAAPERVHSHVDTEDREPLRRALATLPARQRRAVVLRYYLDLPAAEVAQLLGVSPQAARALTHRGLEGLRRHLPELLMEATDD